jgi:predicted ATP-binding protein involved in virulence
MKITRAFLHNFRSFSELNLNDLKNFNLIVGNNATGKSTLLDALCTGLSPWLQGLHKNLDSRNIEVWDIRCRYHSQGEEGSFEESSETAVLVDLSTHDQKDFTVTRFRRGRGGRTSHSPEKELAKKSKTFVSFAEATALAISKGEPVILPLMCYYGTGRLWLTPKQTKKKQIEARSRLAGYRHSMDPRCNPKDFKEWLKNQAWSSFQKKEESPLYQVVKASGSIPTPMSWMS